MEFHGFERLEQVIEGADAPFTVVPGLYPAAADPRFGPLSGLDPGYLTTQPGTRYHAFYEPAQVDPAVVAYDEMTKGTVTSAELQTYPLILNDENAGGS